MLFRNVECNNVSERGVGLGKDKSGQLFSSFRDKTVRGRKIQEVLQRKLAVGNPWRETHLIKPVEGTEVTGLILPNRYGHRLRPMLSRPLRVPVLKPIPRRLLTLFDKGSSGAGPLIWQSYIFTVTVFTSV